MARRGTGRPLGLIPFLVPGWPSRADFDRLSDALKSMGCAAWELAIPAGGWSSNTGGTIAAALARSDAGLDEILQLSGRLRPAIAVVYKPSIERAGREALLDRMAGGFDQLMLDAPDLDEAGWTAACAARGIGYIPVRAAAALDDEAAERLAETLPQGAMLYLALAASTGSQAAEPVVLSAAVAALRRRRDDLVLTAGFGISTPAQIAALAEIEGLDAVAIGTELLRRLAAGPDAAAAFFEGLRTAAEGKAAAHAC